MNFVFKFRNRLERELCSTYLHMLPSISTHLTYLCYFIYIYIDRSMKIFTSLSLILFEDYSLSLFFLKFIYVLILLNFCTYIFELMYYLDWRLLN